MVSIVERSQGKGDAGCTGRHFSLQSGSEDTPSADDDLLLWVQISGDPHFVHDLVFTTEWVPGGTNAFYRR